MSPNLSPDNSPFFRVLLVDDNPMDRELVQRELGKEYSHLRIMEAGSPQQLQEHLREADFDVVITDYQLRWTNGMEVLHEVKQRKPHCPVIMFTGTGNEEIAVEAMKSGLDDYIVKSVQHLTRLRAAARASLERASASERAERLQDRLSTLLAKLKVGVYRCWPDGRLMETNSALLRILGLAPEAGVVGRTLDEFFLEPQEREARWNNLLQRRDIQEYEARLRRPDGEIIWVSIDETVSESADGELVVEGLMEDVTVRRRAEDALRRGEAEIAHIDRLGALAEMAAGIAHEVNQPLNAIANFALAGIKSLQNGQFDRERLRELLGEISEQSQRAGTMVRHLRNFARRRTERRQLENLHAILEESVALIAYETRRREAPIELALVAANPAVVADRVQIQQVVINLLQNALDAVRAVPAAQRRITVSTDLRNGMAEVVVRDRGSGLPSDDMKQVFKPYFTTKSEGLGLGLPICKTIVESHGGRIWVTPEDPGAAFHFTLPLANESRS